MSLLQKQLQQEMAKKVNQIEIKDASSGKVWENSKWVQMSPLTLNLMGGRKLRQRQYTRKRWRRWRCNHYQRPQVSEYSIIPSII
jgi:hypothetical protein